MSYITEIFDRMNLQQVREFLLHGTECLEIDSRSYQCRIDESTKKTINNLQKLLPKPDDQDEISNIVCECLSEYQAVYMEIGLQAGAMLTAQIISQNN